MRDQAYEVGAFATSQSASLAVRPCLRASLALTPAARWPPGADSPTASRARPCQHRRLLDAAFRVHVALLGVVLPAVVLHARVLLDLAVLLNVVLHLLGDGGRRLSTRASPPPLPRVRARTRTMIC